MNTIIVNILCEGQTEELFVKEMMKPFFHDSGIVLKHRLLCTSRKKNAKGGMISYQQAKSDLSAWMNENNGRNSEIHYYTTMFDFYALPNDFPCRDEALRMSNAYQQVECLEKAFSEDFSSKRFIPYIQLHEFEALLFCDIKKLISHYPSRAKAINTLAEILSDFQDNPELVNNSPSTAPSKRIIKAIEGDKTCNYKKPKAGASVTKEIGIDKLMSMCKHFKGWIEEILNLVNSVGTE